VPDFQRAMTLCVPALLSLLWRYLLLTTKNTKKKEFTG
jgi:hypothetical protein